MKIWKAEEVKALMLSSVLYQLRFMAAVTECGNGSFGVADVFGIRPSGYTSEFEIKVSKADLMGEIRSIRAIVEEVDLFSAARAAGKRTHAAKYPKHSAYLKGEGYLETMYEELEMRPNQFYFVVPAELGEVAKEGLKGTPYGLYVITDEWGNLAAKKRAELLHQKKATERLKDKIMHKACTELQVTRRQLAQRLRCTLPDCPELVLTRCPGCTEKLLKDRRYRAKDRECWKRVEKEAPDFQDPRRREIFQACMLEGVE